MVIAPPWVRIALAGALLAAAFGAGWAVNGWRLDSTYEAERTEALAESRRQLQAAINERDALAVKLNDANDAHLKQFQEAQNETTRLRDATATGAVRLRVAAKCSAVAELPQAASSARVDDGAGAELAAPARQAYFTLRDGINAVESKLSACQEELRLISRTQSPP